MPAKITNEGLAELLDAKMTGLKAEIKASTDFTGYKLDQLIDYQKVQNGRIDILENETRMFRLIHRNPGTSLAIIILILAGCLVLWPYVLKAIF
jgi:hypothetical protein